MVVTTRATARGFYLNKLPNEMHQTIFSLLSARDARSLRRASKHWFEVGSRGTVEEIFDIRPHLDDMKKLAYITTWGYLAACVKEVRVYTGSDLVPLLKWSPYGTLVPTCSIDQVQRDIKAKENDFCNLDRLRDLLSKLPNFHKLQILTYESPLRTLDLTTGVVLRLSEICQRNIAGRQHESCHFRVLLAALGAVLTRPRRDMSLVFDSFPFTFPFNAVVDTPTIDIGPLEKAAIDFPPVYTILQTMQPLLKQVKDLRLNVNFHQKPHGFQAQGLRLSNFISSMEFLTVLDLSWNAPRLTVMVKREWEFAFSLNYWRHLHTLRLQSIVLSTGSLSNFIQRHGKTLRNLSLGYSFDGFEERSNSCRSLLQNFRQYLNLEKFQLLIQEVPGNDVNEKYDNYLWDRNWNPSARNWSYSTTWRKDFKKEYTDEKLLEFFVLKQCTSWPMDHDYLDRLQIWRRLPEWCIEDVDASLAGDNTLHDRLPPGFVSQ